MLVDTNILIDVLNNEPVWADWSILLPKSSTGRSQGHALIKKKA